MKSTKCLSFLYLLVFLVSLDISFSVISVEARKNSGGKSRHHHQKQNNGHHSATPAAPSPTSSGSGSFNVLSFGAKGDGATDDTEALIKAWESACKVAGATVEIPAGHKFFIQPITLQGPCMPHLILQIDGTVLAPPKASSWPKSGLFQWINVKWAQYFTIQGNGVVDGQGSEWWTSSCHGKNFHVPDQKPTALRFYGSSNITVRDIKIVNSPLCHLKFDNSMGVTVQNVSISSPGDSPNTDGIHLQNTRDVEIHHTKIAAGDDCVSIQTGCSNVYLHHITCGPGHGISLGGLGKDRSVACVSDIIVEDIFLHNTMVGVRIKTWPGGMGSVKNVSFSRIHVSEVKTPLEIDQFYCDNHINCNNYTGAVAISNIQFSRILGTYSVQPLHIACSDDVPCVDVNLIDIQLKPSTTNNGGCQIKQAQCSNSYGKTEAPLAPSEIDSCLRAGRRSKVAKVGDHSSHDHLCQQQ